MNTLLDRFVAKVDFSGDCWLWVASLDGKGYGQINVGGKPRRAHRISYELFVDFVDEGLVLDHLCRTPQCVNPNHLEPVTHRENLRRGIHWQRKKTKCPKNHEYDMIGSKGERGCRRCKNESTRKSKIKLKVART